MKGNTVFAILAVLVVSFYNLVIETYILRMMFGTSRPFFGMANKIDVSKTKKHPVLCLCNQVAERPDCWVVKAYPAGQVNGETPKGDVLQWFKRSKKTPDHLSEVVGQWEKMDISN